VSKMETIITPLVALNKRGKSHAKSKPNIISY